MTLSNIFRYFRNNVPKVSIRLKKPLLHFKKTINNVEDIVELIRANSDTDTFELKEHLWIVLLSKANTVIGISEIAVGGFNNVTTNTREIAQLGLLSNAGRIIIIHNHTSNEACLPSKADVLYTQELKSALNLFEIGLLDHIILTRSSHYSFSNDKKLN